MYGSIESEKMRLEMVYKIQQRTQDDTPTLMEAALPNFNAASSLAVVEEVPASFAQDAESLAASLISPATSAGEVGLPQEAVRDQQKNAKQTADKLSEVINPPIFDLS